MGHARWLFLLFLLAPVGAVAQAPDAPPVVAQAGSAEAANVADAAGEAEAAQAAAAQPTEKKAEKEQKGAVEKFLPILILLFVVAVVLWRLPPVEGVEHTKAFRRRRVMNWLPLGLTYAFLYMGRYNIKVSQHKFGEMQNALGEPMMANVDFSTIFFWGTAVYGCSFLINGPLTDRLGGKFAILMGAGGALIANAVMGVCTWYLVSNGVDNFVGNNFVALFSVLYAINMYFQSFGAVAIVKCNAPWFHVRERGVFGAIFGILISLGVYFAYDWGYLIISNLELYWVFFIPTLLLAAFWISDVIMVRNTPGEAGFDDFDTADASSGDDGPRLPVVEIFKKMMTNPIIVTIALIEFCSGFLRQSIMQWFRTFAKQTDGVLGLKGSFVYDNWGALLCCAGIMGGLFAGIISDRVFQSRRGPVAGVLYAMMGLSAVVLSFTYDTQIVGWLVVFMSMCVIGVHGMLSGTASMDFGGKKNVGVAVGIIDGFVYAGTAVMALTYGIILPQEQLDANGKIIGEAANPDNWQAWPISMIPLAIIGFFLALRVWNAHAKDAR